MASNVVDDKLEKLQSFMKDVKAIEKRDEVLTSDKQIERLTKPGSKYLNLNPYEVLQISPDATAEQIRKTYKKLSILVHPDKNQDDQERAQKAFEAVTNANKLLQDNDEVKKIKRLLEEADAMMDLQLKEKRKEVKKISSIATIQEDENPEIFAKFKRAITAKLFADNEIKKQEVAERQQQERKREREGEIEQEEKVKKQKEFEKKWDESRTERVNDWRNFQKNVSKKEKKHKTFKSFKPPSMKPEKR